jgi:acetyl esterase/lipase
MEELSNLPADSLQFHANMPRTICLAFLLALGLAAQEIPTPPADVILQTDIDYSRVGGRLAMDVVMPRAGKGPFPAVICIHGGGFRAGNRASFLPIATSSPRRAMWRRR